MAEKDKLELKMIEIFLPLTKRHSVKEALQLWRIIIEWNDEQNKAQLVFEDKEGVSVP